MTAPRGLEQRLLGFREAFDRAFALAPATAVEMLDDLLAIRVAGDPYALRMRDLTGLVASGKIVPLPSPRPELLGVAGIRGSLVTIYSLASLLGYGADGQRTSWVALAGTPQRVGLGFDDFEGFLRVQAADVHGADPAARAGPHLGEVVRVRNVSHRIVDIPSTLAAIHAGGAGSSKESR